MNLATNLEASAYYFPTRPVVRQDGSELTYGELNDRANRIATGLIKMGINPGDHIGLCSINSIDWIAFYFGILKAGAVAVTLSGLLKGQELKNIISHSKPRFVFTTEDKLSDLNSIKDICGIEKIVCPDGDFDLSYLIDKGSGSFKAIDRDRSDTAVILYTGGTTGTPKGVMLSHEGVIFSSHSIAYYEHSNENDLALCFLPFNHVFGQIHIMNATIISGGCIELLPSFDLEKVLELIRLGRVTKFFAVPTVYVRLLGVGDLSEGLGRLRYCFSAGASLAMEIVKRWKECTGITIAESYGMTEAMPVTFNHYYPEKHIIGSVGQLVHGVEALIMDTSGNVLEQGREGEICIRGRNVMKGYLNNPEGTASAFWQNEWFRSGDIGVADKDGYFYIVDRVKDIIITGGENVYPREVEELIHTIPEVADCSVIGLPDPEWGERVCVCIVPKQGHKIIQEDIKMFLKSRLSPFKVPKECIIVAELPKSSTGKILKSELKKMILRERL
ncbi:MAG: AMP-binding protein [Syntrophorhabdaceae bacterium]|nr:AMP-binding protein [Syntrophorhabdaceae bacterium]